MKKIIFAAIGAAVCAYPAIAQNVDTNAEPIALGAPQTSVLRAGTSVPLKTLVGLTTEGKKLKVGHRFELEVAEAVSVDGQVVIPVGSPAVGEVTSVRNKGMWGKSGHIETRMLYVRANGRQIRLSGSIDDKGVTGTAGVVAAVVLVPVVGFFVTGTSAQIPAGSNITGFVQEDVPIAFSAPTPVAITVPAPAAPMVAPVATVTTVAAAPVAEPVVAQPQQ
ncbi:hypothetical protein [Sphingosinicella sp.]|jgi:hypothetical protein|uniref:hypothetical protein n=2 Tax=Sphingosinicella sp. TaxID=1917971 RepID=UPI0025D444BE|nr:hypothetical protein [Sphingosinicella sp.]